MLRTRIFFAFSIFLLACSSNTSYSKEKEAPKEGPKKPKDELPVSDHIWLKEDNAIPFLTHYGEKNPERKFRISTKFGDIDIQLFDDTPIHTSNFVYLVKEKNYFEDTFFYRVKPEFIIQGGNSDNEKIEERRFMIGTYSLPAEFSPKRYHKRGAVAMSRNYGNNPDKRSTPYDFYIVAGKKVSDYVLYTHQREKSYTYPTDHFQSYLKLGGAPHLDQEHTVFGEVLSGMDVVDQISRLEADKSEWPLEDVKMQIRILD